MVSAKEQPWKAHMLGLHGEKTPTYEKEEFRGLEKALLGGRGPLLT